MPGTDRSAFVMDDPISLRNTTLKLFAYCKRHDWAGYDPYDALNSELLRKLPILDRRLFRLALTQALKRLPFDFRPVLSVPATENPKALALFLSSSLKLNRLGLIDDPKLPRRLSERILALRSAGENYWAWGYSFPWQTRLVVVPRGAANLVCTTFVAQALLDYYEDCGDETLLEAASSAGQYLVDALYYNEPGGVASFSYPLPSSTSKVHNANLLAAALLARLFTHSHDDRLRDVALAATRYSASKQNPDGSWYYGEDSTQRWIDNFHTGYNLRALRALARFLDTREFDERIHLGFKFYREHFFREDGAVRYFHDRAYPIDIHCVAESILTLLEFQERDRTSLSLARTIYGWAIKHLWDNEGYFYYRALRTLTIRIPYIRWSEAWMLLALTSLIEAQESARLTAPASLSAAV